VRPSLFPGVEKRSSDIRQGGEETGIAIFLSAHSILDTSDKLFENIVLARIIQTGIER